MPSRFLSSTRNDSQLLSELTRRVSKAVKDTMLQKAIGELHFRCGVFDRLRKAMRITLPNGNKGLNDDGSPEAMTTIRKQVEKFRLYLEKDSKLICDKLVLKMAKQIDKYMPKLFADPIEVETPKGKTTIYPQRTNNILEQFFRKMRREYRRKTGNNSMCRALRTMLADTPLVKNLENPDYMKIFLNGKNSLEELLVDLEAMLTVNNPGILADSNRMLPGFRKLINLPNFHIQAANLLAKPRKMVKSN